MEEDAPEDGSFILQQEEAQEMKKNGLNVRREAALLRLKEKLKMNDGDLVKVSKRFKKSKTASKEDIEEYRKYLKKSINILKKTVKLNPSGA